MVGVDPAQACLAVARAKPGAQRVRRVEGDAAAVDVTDREIALLTGNTAQAISDPGQWAVTSPAYSSRQRS